MSPKRVQRRRQKGWKMPPNTVYVGRPSKWGNPFVTYGMTCYDDKGETFCETREEAVEKFRQMMLKMSMDDSEAYRYFIEPLKGKNLACWCSLNNPCHADILLEFANKNM